MKRWTSLPELLIGLFVFAVVSTICVYSWDYVFYGKEFWLKVILLVPALITTPWAALFLVMSCLGLVYLVCRPFMKDHP